MGRILSSFKTSLVDELIQNISSNTSYYYAFAANPISYVGDTPSEEADDYYTTFSSNWQLLFGKKLSNTNIVPIIEKNVWTSNTVYNRYDNTAETLTDFYVVVDPTVEGGYHHVYKCIDNANGAASTSSPSIVQQESFQTADNYVWRYITSISDSNYSDFSTTYYIPLIANNIVKSNAGLNSGVEVIVVANSGSGYSSYANGLIVSVANSTVIQIAANSSSDNGFYTNNGIYIYNPLTSTSQLLTVSNYVSNTNKWVILSEPANTTNIAIGSSQYYISPKVLIETDGAVEPTAYSVINSVSNSISSVIILETGSEISWANVTIQSNTIYGTGANAYAIVPPAGGHGYDASSELGVKGMCISFSFEADDAPTEVLYNKIGLLKNPYELQANGSRSSNTYTSATFNQLMTANVSSNVEFTVGDSVTGATSGSKGTVAFANSTVIYLTGDKTFANGETITSSNGVDVSTITINTIGDIYSKSIRPIYIQNISNVERLNYQAESFKLLFQIDDLN